jgi:hypothetical protein
MTKFPSSCGTCRKAPGFPSVPDVQISAPWLSLNKTLKASYGYQNGYEASASDASRQDGFDAGFGSEKEEAVGVKPRGDSS